MRYDINSVIPLFPGKPLYVVTTEDSPIVFLVETFTRTEVGCYEISISKMHETRLGPTTRHRVVVLPDSVLMDILRNGNEGDMLYDHILRQILEKYDEHVLVLGHEKSLKEQGYAPLRHLFTGDDESDGSFMVEDALQNDSSDTYDEMVVRMRDSKYVDVYQQHTGHTCIKTSICNVFKACPVHDQGYCHVCMDQRDVNGKATIRLACCGKYAHASCMERTFIHGSSKCPFCRATYFVHN
jgi:hypothetical protein